MKSTMRFLAFTGAIVLSVSLTARARLGETEKQCDARYGTNSVVVTNDGTVLQKAYVFNAMIIVVRLLDGEVHSVAYQKEKEDDALPLPLGSGEIDILLAANAGTSRWEKADLFALAGTETNSLLKREILTKAARFETWYRFAQGGRTVEATAEYDTVSETLHIYTPRIQELYQSRTRTAMTKF